MLLCIIWWIPGRLITAMANDKKKKQKKPWKLVKLQYTYLWKSKAYIWLGKEQNDIKYYFVSQRTWCKLINLLASLRPFTLAWCKVGVASDTQIDNVSSVLCLTLTKYPL